MTYTVPAPKLPSLPPEPSTEPLPPAPPAPPASASAAAHPFTVTPDEGLFAVPQPEVVTALQGLLRHKYTALLQYVVYADALRVTYRDSVAQHFNDHQQEERAACYDLAMKITALGGEPTVAIDDVPVRQGVQAVMTAVMDAEKAQIGAARACLRLTGDNVALRVWLENLILTDQRHLDDARRMLVNIP